MSVLLLVLYSHVSIGIKLVLYKYYYIIINIISLVLDLHGHS